MSFLSNRPDRVVVGSLGSLFALGVVTLVMYFSRPSEIGNQFLFGLSLSRMVVGFLFAGMVFISGAVFISLFRPFQLFRQIWERINYILSDGKGLYISLTVLYGAVLFLIASLVLSTFPVAKSAEFIVGAIQRLDLPILWLTAVVIVLGFLVLYMYQDVLHAKRRLPLLTVLWLWMFLGVYILLLMYFRSAAYASYLGGFEFPLLGLGGYFLIWALINTFMTQNTLEKINNLLTPVGVFLTVLFLYQHLALWAGQLHQSQYEYWDSLALQFVNGKLYLADGSVTNFTTHDLTLYENKWYVPIPPLPAILMMPLVLFIKPDDIFMGDVSMLVAALNAMLLYLILVKLAAHQWVQLSKKSTLLLVLLFSVGTNHLWVGIMGDVWFVSQMVTVAFLSLAVLAALWDASPWMVGALIGAAMIARPNSLMTWTFVFAIAMQIKKDDGLIVNFNHMFDWTLRSALPIGLAILGLFAYNYARFNDFLDFGYVTISGEATIVNNAQTFGLFSPHYIWNNLRILFISLPEVHFGDKWLFQPSLEGMSIFFSTPVLFYLFRSYEKKWWVVGAWLSVVLGLSLLVMYHNTGSAQFGYRYILDVILPIMALLSVSIQKKIPWHFYILLLLSIVINIYGLIWFVNAN